MKRNSFQQAGFTFLELMTAMAITTVLLGSVAAATFVLQKSFLGNKTYTKGVADNSRAVDYIARDLRNATAVSRRTGGNATPFKKGTFDITETDQLCVFVPNFYMSNVPDNSYQSTYKKPFFSRENMNGQPYYPYNDVVVVVGVTRRPKYTGTLEVRYLKKARSASDSMVCMFRMEYENGTLRRADEISDRADSQTVTVNAVGLTMKKFQITSSFKSYWSGEAARKASRQFSTVYLENTRTDKYL